MWEPAPKTLQLFPYVEQKHPAESQVHRKENVKKLAYVIGAFTLMIFFKSPFILLTRLRENIKPTGNLRQ